MVDDGSACPVESDDHAHCDIEVLHHPHSKGAGPYCNTGLAACTTDFVAFLDSDVTPRRGWLESFTRPLSAIPPSHSSHLASSACGKANPVARCEALHSSLDSGQREAPVLPHSTVSAPSAIVCRSSAIRDVGGFDETMHSGKMSTSAAHAGARLPRANCAGRP